MHPAAPKRCARVLAGRLLNTRLPARTRAHRRIRLILKDHQRYSKPGVAMFKNYLKIAFKVFLRRKFFTFISLFAISFTLIILMVATAMIDNAIGPQPPEDKADRMLSVFRLVYKGPNSLYGGTAGYAFLDRYVRTLSNVEKVSIFSTPTILYSLWMGEKIKSFLKRSDGQFWEILEFKFLEGGQFTAEDEKNANFVAVINEATRRKFFGDEPAVGKMIEADGQQFRVIGVVGN